MAVSSKLRLSAGRFVIDAFLVLLPVFAFESGAFRSAHIGNFDDKRDGCAAVSSSARSLAVSDLAAMEPDADTAFVESGHKRRSIWHP